MLETILDLEKKLIRVETWLLVACVLIMLVLAGYNVAYRNFLVPWQTQLLTSGPPVTTDEQAAKEAPSGTPDSAEKPADSKDGFAGGFGGAADEGEEADDDFAGGFGAPEGDDTDDPAEPEPEQEEGSFEGGFGAAAADDAGEDEGDFEGGFGGSADEPSDDDIGGGFAADETDTDSESGATDEGDEALEASNVAEEVADDVGAEPEGGPPPEGSFADTMVGVIDTMKLSWIDILLRQLVIISGFLGAMLAARRRNHITIDAVGKLLDGRPRHIVDSVTSSVSVVVCAVLAVAGWDLVAIGLEYPSELLPWAEEWTFQLAFPIGFGLLALHFAVRVYESIIHAIDYDESDQPDGDDGPSASEATAGGAI